MEFNELTLQPTYKLIHGLSGASSGLKIAERLKMAPHVLEAALNYLEASDLEAAHYVEELRRRVSDLEQEKSKFEKERAAFEEWKRKELDDLTAQHKEEIARVKKRLERIVQELSDRGTRELESVGEESVRKFQKKLASVKAHAAGEIKREREKIERTDAGPAPSAGSAGSAQAAVNEGSLVRVLSMGVTGTVTAIKGAEAEILVGNIKLRRPESDSKL